MNPWLRLAAGVAACSTAVIFIKAAHTSPLWLAAERLLLAALLLAPFAVRDARRCGRGAIPRAPNLLWPACFLALHFATWVAAARSIPAANSTLIANFTPIVMPLVALLLLREGTSRRELLATAIGVAGIGAMALGDLDASASHLLGDGLCAGSMVALAVYLALARRARRGAPLWLYMVPVFACAGAMCALAALVVEGVPPIPDAHEAAVVVGLAILPTVIGHSLMNRAMGELRPQVVSLAGLGNVPCAAFMAWLLWREVPSPSFWVALCSYLVAVGLLLLPRAAR